MSTEIEKLRKKIGDPAKAQRDILTGNGTDRVMSLQYQNVFDVVLTVDSEEPDPSAYTINTQAGRITFNVAPATDVPVVVDYLYAAYTDAELTEILEDTENNITDAAIVCIEEIAMGAARFYDFQQGETSEKKSQVFSNLMKLLESYKTQKANDDAVKSKGLRLGRRSSGPRRVRPYLQDITQSPSRRW